MEAVVAYHKAHEGVSRVVKIQQAHQLYLGIDLTVDAHGALCRHYSELVEQKVIDCDSVAGALDFLVRATGQLKTFVVSGTPEDELRRITGRRGIHEYFTGVYGSPRNKVEIVDELLQIHKLSAEKCLFIGDAMTDYNAAKTCGVPFLGRLNDGENSPFPMGTDTVADLARLTRIAGLQAIEEPVQ